VLLALSVQVTIVVADQKINFDLDYT